jgi:two-component system, NtrC family, sensor histidine kinase HydH
VQSETDPSLRNLWFGAKRASSIVVPNAVIVPKLHLPARWFDGAAIVVALVAALALAATVFVARRELQSASIALVRGEGETLASRVHERANTQDGPPTQASLDAHLEALRPAGVRFLALPNVGLAAGEARLDHRELAPGIVLLRDNRAALVSVLPPHPRGPLPPLMPGMQGRPPILIVEFEPSVLARVNAGMNHTVVVAGAAVLVLLSLAGALTTRMIRRTQVAVQAEQDKRLAALGQMAGVMAHELRNPLTSLKGHAQLLAEMLDVGSPAQLKAELVVTEALRLEALTQALLAFVRDGALVMREVSPAELVEHALRDLDGARVEVDLSAAPKALSVDDARISVAISNLVQNALQATQAGERVRLRVIDQPLEVAIEVHDSGPGIAAGDKDRIFEPFFTTRIHGTGLGLSVARRAVEGHGGTLRALESSGQGAIFKICLPKAGMSPASRNEVT